MAAAGQDATLMQVVALAVTALPTFFGTRTSQSANRSGRHRYQATKHGRSKGCREPERYHEKAKERYEEVPSRRARSFVNKEKKIIELDSMLVLLLETTLVLLDGRGVGCGVIVVLGHRQVRGRPCRTSCRRKGKRG